MSTVFTTTDLDSSIYSRHTDVGSLCLVFSSQSPDCTKCFALDRWKVLQEVLIDSLVQQCSGEPYMAGWAPGGADIWREGGGRLAGCSVTRALHLSFCYSSHGDSLPFSYLYWKSRFKVPPLRPFSPMHLRNRGEYELRNNPSQHCPRLPTTTNHTQPGN